MKKVTNILVFIALCIFIIVGCQKQFEKNININFESIANAVKIEVSHSLDDQQTNQIIEDTDTINQIANWLNTFILHKVSFAEGESPDDIAEKEKFCFIVYDATGTTTNFCYIITHSDDSDNCYIFYQSQWYSVENPNTPSFKK